MALEKVMDSFSKVNFNPRTLQVNLPTDLTAHLSSEAKYFLTLAYSGNEFTGTVIEYLEARWKNNPEPVKAFFNLSDEGKMEVLGFLTLFVHEYTHKTDFLISPFGLLFYCNCLNEYWVLQQFFPQALDDKEMVDKIRFLVNFEEDLIDNEYFIKHLKSNWAILKPIIHVSYAWGDVSNINLLKKFIKPGWGETAGGKIGNYFGVEKKLETITILDFFYSFRDPDNKNIWHLRPLTIFETKAVVNTLLYILDLLKEEGVDECISYYKTFYLNRKETLPEDYFFLLDMGAKIYDIDSFEKLLLTKNLPMIKSVLISLSGICWYSLHAPPVSSKENFCYSNPILRLWAAFLFVTKVMRGETTIPPLSMSEALSYIEIQEEFKNACQKPINQIVPDCLNIIDRMKQANQEKTWNPEVRAHFDHIFTIMRPHFSRRSHDYVSYFGMPDNGNPLASLRTREEWEGFYDDYVTPTSVFDWYDIRSNVFFTLLKPKEEIIQQIDQHFMAYLSPFVCPNGCGITLQWISRFFETTTLRCGNCGCETKVNRDDTTIIHYK